MNPLGAGSFTALPAPEATAACRPARMDAQAWQQEMARAAPMAAQAVVVPRPVLAGAGVHHGRTVGAGGDSAERSVPRDFGPLRPVRLHARWEGSSVELWLGVDASAAASLPDLLSALAHECDASRWRLRRVVCNGRDLPGIAHRPAAPPMHDVHRKKET